jgi:hypothetical protein
LATPLKINDMEMKTNHLVGTLRKKHFMKSMTLLVTKSTRNTWMKKKIKYPFKEEELRKAKVMKMCLDGEND